MPGTFAHLTLVDHLTSGEFLNDADLPVEAKIAAQDFSKFVDLGAVSPDYPYLAVSDGTQKHWADQMHYTRTGTFIRRLMDGAAALRGTARQSALAWCMGYVGHVVTDMTIHPVVEMKVGPYEGNELAHRICEMHQDTYIFQRLNLDRLGLAEYLDSNLAKCSDPADEVKLDPIIGALWTEALGEIYPATLREFGAPRIDLWHGSFVTLIDKVATEGNAFGLIPLARHVLQNNGLVYPELDDVDLEEYITSVATPEGPMSYDDIFDRARDNVADAWRIVTSYVVDGDATAVQHFGPWNLDTGRNVETDAYVYWNA